MGHHDRIHPSNLHPEDLDTPSHTQQDPATDHHRSTTCPPSEPAWNQFAASYSSSPIPLSLKADDTQDTSIMQEQPSDYKNATVTGYQSGNNSNTATKGRVTGLTMRHHQPAQDANRKNDDRQQQPRPRPKSADFSYRRSGVDSMSRVSGAEFAKQFSISATPTIASPSGSKTNGWSLGSIPLTSSGRGGGGGGATQQLNKGPGLAQQRRRASMLRVRIERGLMVGMACLAGYRMMTLDYSNIQDKEGSAASTSWSDSGRQSQIPNLQQGSQHDAIPGLARSAWILGAGFLLLALIHAFFLTAHDRHLQFPLHNKNLPLQPLRKRSSRFLNANASQAVAAAAVAAESDDDSEDDEALQRNINAELQQESLLLSQEGAQGTSGNGGMAEPALGSWQSRFCWSAESAVPQWRVWGSEAHWYRKGADNGSIFATVLVPIVLAAKFVQTVTDEKFLSTGTHGVRTAETVLSSMAFSLIFGTSILVHMLLLKVFDQTGTGSKHPHHSRKGSIGASGSTILDSIFLPSAMTTSSTLSTSMSANNLSNSSSLYPKYLQPLNRQQQGVSSPSSPSSPSLSAASSAPSSLLLDHQPSQHQQQYQRQQEIQDAFIFSADQLHHPSLLAGISETDKSSDREEIWIIALGFGGAYTLLLTFLARFKCIPGLENTGAGMVMLIQSVFQMLMIGFAYFYRRSFTFGELAVLAQAITLLIHETLVVNFVTPPPAPGAVLEHPQFMFLLTLVVGMLLIGVLLCPVLMYCRRLAQMPTKGASPANLQTREFKKKVAAGIVYSGLVAIVLGVVMPRCQRVLGENPFLWLVEFMLMTKIFTTTQQLEQPGQSPVTSLAMTNATDAKFGLETLMGARIGWSRLGLCLYWILAVVSSIVFFNWMNTSIRRRSIMGSLNNRRKYYHALAVLMFIPGYLTDEPFMHIAFSVGLASLIFLEYIRYFAVVPYGKEIHLFLVGFLDARDGGPIILSHLYLLMGCAAPVWLAEHHILAGLSGIFALGVGDAMASIVGKRFGRYRWPGTIKTVEGTIAFVVSVMMAAGAVFVGMWLMSFVFGDSGRISSSASMASSSPSLTAGPKALSSSMPPASLLSFSTWNDWSAVTWSVWGVIRYGMAVSVAAMLEAVSEQNDNLVIPVVMLAMVWLI
ncbi:hypothetical protein EDD21DRAFT_340309 [Dissophora ornata]|nr:hypothetical protein BGZ58_007087 [Dissophora ornata]KAI8599042.1 hypothetical protein EDD21DRAFT_340309 [Dissophora ornata]